MSALAQPSFSYKTLLAHVQTLGIPILDFINHLECSFNIEDVIGNGGAMTVYKGLLRRNSQEERVVALKIPKQIIKESSKDKTISGMLSAIRQEIRIMKSLETHPYVVNLYGITFRELKPILVVELAIGSLSDYLSSKKFSGNRVGWETKGRFCYQIADGIRSLHSVNIVHGDIKADNVLLFGNPENENELVAKLSDFGYSATLLSIANGRGTGGTLYFLPPECTPMSPPEMRVFANKPTKDNYSYGLYVWQVATDGEVPYDDMESIESVYESKNQDRQLLQLMNQLPEDTPESFKQIILGMTQYVPNERSDLESVKGIIMGTGEIDSDVAYTEAKEAFEVSVKNIPESMESVKLRSLLSMSIPSSIKRRLLNTYEMAAENGDPEAAYFISVCYGSEFGVKLDKTKMISWAIKAAEGGRLEAVKSIALSSFDSFEQLPENRNQLFPWLQKTAESGHRESQFLVSQCYLNGVCVEKDEAKYEMWYMKFFDTSQSVTQPEDLLQSESPLHCAAREGNLENIKFFIMHEKMDVESKNSFGATPLQRAAVYNHVDAINLLVDEFKADINARDNNDLSILHLVANIGHIEIVKLLIDKYKIDINIRMKGDWTPLHLAAKEGHTEVARLLVVGFGANVDAKTKQSWTPLHSAVQRDRIEMVKLLVAELKADVNIKMDNGQTPLHYAVYKGYMEMVKLLIDILEAEVNIQDNSGWAPLHSAAQNGDIQMVRLLVEFGADVDIKTNSGWTPLHSAAENGDIQMVRLLAESGADMDVKTINGWTSLHSAAENGHIEIVKLLVAEFRVDVKAKTKQAWTPLHLASQNGYIQMVILLVTEFGAEVDAKGNDNWTPLYIAAENGHVEIVRLLGAKFGADVNIKKNDGGTPLYSAIEHGHIEMVKLLVGDLRANLNDVDGDDLTPLAYSVIRGNIEVVTALLEQPHASITTRTKDGQTLLHLAVKYRREAIVKMLVEKFNMDIYARNENGQTPLELADEPPIHFNFFCDGCNQDIIGERHRCTICTNFDFCDTCYYSSKDHSHSHIFQVVELPSVKYLLVSH